MKFPRFAYRSRQFWHALLKPEAHVPDGALRIHLNSAQIILFRQLQPSEQLHAYRVYNQLNTSERTNPDLLAAALLHDIGKIHSPLSIFDRIVIVIGKHLFPKAARGWGTGRPHGWRRPFVVAEQHAAWGADLAEKAGVSVLAADLIRSHHEATSPEPASKKEQLLVELQAADDGN
jgi:putative nucleotidyltransferase with HDIG domain